MFDLEQAIEHWRGQLLEAGIQSAEVVAELEAHLREDIDRQTKAGISVPEAFGRTLQNLGNAAALQDEFRKVRHRSSIGEKVMLGICGVLIGFVVFLSGVTILLCYETWGERIMASVAVISILLVARAWSYAVPFLPLMENSRLRWATGLSCIGVGFVLLNLLSLFVLPHFEIGPDRQLPAVGLWAIFLLALFCCTGVGLLLSKRQREVWGMTRPSATTATLRRS
ncbi:MAG TPA: hypothetical protein VL361_04035 [Candidatus Limnocylindrales bacterium]|nr:hypothetical protein [Candidatus Limnocylindrales bacterium]